MPNRSLRNPIATDAVEKTPIAVVGITAAELARRARLPRRRETLEPAELTRWLVTADFAEQRGELLWPTDRGIEIGREIALVPDPD
jgi:hypothetical protein